MGLLKKILESRYRQDDGTDGATPVHAKSDTPCIRIKPLKFEVRSVETWTALGQAIAGKELAADSIMGKFSIGQEDDGGYVLKLGDSIKARDNSPTALISFAQNNYHAVIRNCLETSGIVVMPYLAEKE